MRGFPLRGYLIPECNGTGACTPWKLFSARRRRHHRRPWSMAGMDQPSTNVPTYCQRTNVPPYHQDTNVPTYMLKEWAYMPNEWAYMPKEWAYHAIPYMGPDPVPIWDWHGRPNQSASTPSLLACRLTDTQASLLLMPAWPTY